jgi:hypothetical protein
MAWNTHRMQALIDDKAQRETSFELSQLIQLGPLSTRHINFRGILHFPIEQFAGPIFRKEVPIAKVANN